LSHFVFLFLQVWQAVIPLEWDNFCGTGAGAGVGVVKLGRTWEYPVLDPLSRGSILALFRGDRPSDVPRVFVIRDASISKPGAIG
jgi:hypothetical protein